ncbi:TPA: HdeD family acid-resistance protein [Legionella pneumophila subsp. pneumophila]|uniref:HdeD family acid-resistance protein n=1 Tax=Legionella pneumophila TaxID=446 RepID=UPI00058EFB10|nr:HdeD family acid-resistance protein [Legionella pneumophila]MDC8030556.1 HdeD family acid-resistance protein [Legionella pneumophila subsp. pneumophila]MDW8870931.1 HdeD family acid-resistance protein [Legionella pneumophila]MDW8916941.1 HdeD family acid-resistance protein [Legionella pneumophila]MDW8925127.1 HdeD family acid-resistance protein [Legionella pneumophila]MDW8931415.1 HdeD family acid-resistance protein [Legionella pneumophila]
MANSQEFYQPPVDELKRNWGWILGFGIFFLILGCVGLGMVVGLTLVSMFFFGALLIVGGISHIIDVFKYKEWKGMIWQALIAVLYIAAGCIVLYDPFLASTLITAFLAAVLIVIGLTRMIMAFALKDSKGWGWLLLAGITAMILGILILMQWPVSGLWIIGLFIAIELIVTGWTYIFIAISVKTAKL